MVEASGSVAAVAETGALTPCLTDIAGGGMQVEEDVDDLENTQVSELGRKMERRQQSQRKRSCAARNRLGRGTAEVKDITSRLMQDAVDRDRRLDQHMMEQLTGLVVDGVSETMAGDVDKKGAKSMDGV